MASIVLRDVPKELKNRLQEQAVRNRRSMAQEALMILEREFRVFPPIELPAKPHKLLKPITSEMVLKAIRSGRK